MEPAPRGIPGRIEGSLESDQVGMVHNLSQTLWPRAPQQHLSTFPCKLQDQTVRDLVDKAYGVPNLLQAPPECVP